MAEKIRVNARADKGAIYVFDKTGKYQKKCNSGGWGHPNFKVSDISKAEISVYPPEQEDPIVIDVYPYLPNDEGIGFEILAQDLGLEEITSGVWRLVTRFYHAPDQEGEQVLSCADYFYFDDVISCCVDKMKLKLDISDTSSDLSKKVVELESLLDNAKWAACKGDRDKAQEIAKYISLQCKCSL